MTHLAMQEADEEGSPVIWGEHVTDEEYDRTSIMDSERCVTAQADFREPR